MWSANTRNRHLTTINECYVCMNPLDIPRTTCGDKRH